MWKDATSYSQGDKERKPTSFEVASGELRIYITCRHISYRGEWIMHCKAVGIDTLHMKTCKTQGDAEKRAIHNVRLKLERLIESLNTLSHNVAIQGLARSDSPAGMESSTPTTEL